MSNNVSNNLLNDLYNLPECGVFCLINEDSKQVLVLYSISTIDCLSRLIQSIRLGESYCRNIDPNRFKFVVLDVMKQGEVHLANRLKVRADFYMRKFKEEGYTLLKEDIPARYRAKTVISIDTTRSFSAKVVLVSARNSKILVGKFDSIEKCEEFKQRVYPNEYADDIILDEALQKHLESL